MNRQVQSRDGETVDDMARLTQQDVVSRLREDIVYYLFIVCLVVCGLLWGWALWQLFTLVVIR